VEAGIVDDVWDLTELLECCGIVFEAYYRPTKPPLLPWVKGTLVLWTTTLPITLLFAALSGMAADAGDHWWVDVFIWSAFTYPLSIIAGFLFRRKRPVLVLLPCVNIALWLFADAFSGH
jgi:hypothetical protein